MLLLFLFATHVPLPLSNLNSNHIYLTSGNQTANARFIVAELNQGKVRVG